MHPRVEQLIRWQQENGTTQKSQDWLDVRRRFLTASDVAAVTTKSGNGYKTAPHVILEKMGIGPKFEGNEATRHGEAYEDEAIRIYEEQTGRRVYQFGLLFHPTIEGLAGSPDGITECGVLIEVKVSTLGILTSLVSGVPGVTRRAVRASVGNAEALVTTGGRGLGELGQSDHGVLQEDGTHDTEDQPHEEAGPTALAILTTLLTTLLRSTLGGLLTAQESTKSIGHLTQSRDDRVLLTQVILAQRVLTQGVLAQRVLAQGVLAHVFRTSVFLAEGVLA